MQNEKKIISRESEVSIEAAVHDAQLMVAYVANKGPVGYKKETLETIIESKYLLQEKKFTREAEIAFWLAYRELACHIHPVSINSLKSSLSKPYCSVKKKYTKPLSKASRTAYKYRSLAFITLAALLFAQIYYIIGANVASEMETIFNERQKVRMEMDRVSNLKGLKLYGKYITATDDEELNRLIMKNTTYNQKLDANYQILLNWNRIWRNLSFTDQYEPKIREYRQFEHNELVKFTENYYANLLSNAAKSTTDHPDHAIAMNERMLNLKLDYAAMKARNKLLVTQISAKFVLIAMQTYFLPLLYGLMGALMYALRMLANEIKNLTYDTDSQIRYRLRIFIGAIAGLMIGLFINPEEIEVFNLIAPMAFSFIVGYNVELLFSTMDRIIQVISIRMKSEDTSPSIHAYAESQLQAQSAPEKQMHPYAR